MRSLQAAVAVIASGERTGKFRLGKDHLLTRDKDSNISWEDYAIPQSKLGATGRASPSPSSP